MGDQRHVLGQRKIKLAILAVFAGYPDFLIVGSNDGLGDIQAKSRALFIQSAALIALIEAFKHKRNVIGGDALSAVIDRNLNLILNIGPFRDGYTVQTALT